MKEHSTRLIDGTFTPEQARNISLQLLNDKMNYHYLEKISNEERFGKDHQHSDKRIKELTEEKVELIRWLTGTPPTAQLKISCTIHIKIEE
jgi:hypothetical protein